MLYHLMVKPNSSKATGDKKLGYSNTVKTNNTTYVSHKDKLYFKLSKIRITNELFNTYDNYIKKKYKIDINHKALKTIKDYFN